MRLAAQGAEMYGSALQQTAALGDSEEERGPGASGAVPAALKGCEGELAQRLQVGCGASLRVDGLGWEWGLREWIVVGEEPQGWQLRSSRGAAAVIATDLPHSAVFVKSAACGSVPAALKGHEGEPAQRLQFPSES